MKKIVINFLPHILIIVLFILISAIYFLPALSGDVLSQMDFNHSKGISQELAQYEEETGEQSLWANSIFCGMPAYQIRAGKVYNIYSPIRNTLRLGLPYSTVAIMFIYLLGFYVLMMSLKVNKWLSFIGSIAFALASYNIIIILAGHITKCYAIAYMPAVVAGFLLIFDKKYILGGVIATVALGIQISTSHIQIVYYTGLLVGLLVVFKFIYSLIDKQIKQFGIASGITVLAVILAVLPNIMSLWRAQEIAEYSIRGKKELSQETAKNNNGLDRSYALAWSYGVDETFTLLIPNTKGGSTDAIQHSKKINSKLTPKFIQDISGTTDPNFNQQIKQIFQQTNQYWGTQPFTSGPVYFGAIIVFLFLLGLFVVKDKIKWWLLAATIFSIMLSWGQNFGFLTDIFFDYFPYYNKFRTVSMTLVIAGLTMPLLGMLAIKELVTNPEIIKKEIYKIIVPFALTGGLVFFFLLIPTIFPYLNTQEIAQFDAWKQQQPENAPLIEKIVSGLQTIRMGVFKADALRSFALILFSGVAIFLFLYVKDFKKLALFAVLGLLILIDLWTVDTRYLNHKTFQTKSKAKQTFKATNADIAVLKDKDPNYRVLDLTKNVFNDAYTPYFHKSIGGYHGAKLQKYQNVIDYYLAPYNQMIRNVFNDTTSFEMTELTKNMQVLNMLNVKYLIYNPEGLPAPNKYAFGNAWLVDDFKFVETPDEEIETIGTENLRRIAIINKKKFPDYKFPDLQMSANDSGSIYLTDYKPNHLTYKSKSSKDEFAVFSEIYYPVGWYVYIDGNETEYINVNYLLRGLKIPKGEHTIEFKFQPKSYYTGKTIAIISSIIVLLLIIGLIGKTAFDLYKKGDFLKPEDKQPKKDDKKQDKKEIVNKSKKKKHKVR